MTVSEHDDAVMAVDCLDPVNHYVTVAADGNIKVSTFFHRSVCKHLEYDLIAKHTKNTYKPGTMYYVKGSLINKSQAQIKLGITTVKL